MKRSIKLAVAAAVALTSTAAFATNGDHLIGLGAKARGMGGVGIGMSHGAETALSNPALITSVKNNEISFGGTVFMPDVATDLGEGSYKSDADLSVIPEVSLVSRASDSIWLGIGMWGTAGMGTDYRSETMNAGVNPMVIGNYNMVTNLQLMQFAVPLAYKTGAFSVGFAPVLQYGSLDINYRTPDMTGSFGSMLPAGTTSSGNTQGVAQDFGVGYNFGVAYSEEGLTMGASYKSAIDMTYDGTISSATKDFNLGDPDGPTGAATAEGLSDDLEQPAEIGAGISYEFSGNTIAFDFKQIKWGSAKGYKDFGWEDQNVYMIGYQYAQDNWAVRAGYNYAKNPIKEHKAGSMMNPGEYDGAVLNMMNLLGFPAIVEKHYTLGATYAFNKTLSMDVAYVYVPETTEEYDTTAMTQASYASMGMAFAGTTSAENKHSQDALSFQLNFAF